MKLIGFTTSVYKSFIQGAPAELISVPITLLSEIYSVAVKEAASVSQLRLSLFSSSLCGGEAGIKQIVNWLHTASPLRGSTAQSKH